MNSHLLGHTKTSKHPTKGSLILYQIRDGDDLFSMGVPKIYDNSNVRNQHYVIHATD